MLRIVYLKISENRIIITSSQIPDKDYHMLLSSEGPSADQITRMFCVGYLWGFGSSEMGKAKPINDAVEFM
jgi:hypothetical protein